MEISAAVGSSLISSVDMILLFRPIWEYGISKFLRRLASCRRALEGRSCTRLCQHRSWRGCYGGQGCVSARLASDCRLYAHRHREPGYEAIAQAFSHSAIQPFSHSHSHSHHIHIQSSSYSVLSLVDYFRLQRIIERMGRTMDGCPGEIELLPHSVIETRQ